MSTTFMVGNETYTARRVFSHTTFPAIMERESDRVFWYLGGDPVTDPAHLDWLPEPHRARALSSLTPPETASPDPAQSHGLLASAWCGKAAASAFGLQAHQRACKASPAQEG
mgnify:CR=1 FL=1